MATTPEHAAHLAALTEGLSRPEAFPVPAERVTTRRTHVSVLFFAGERVYKLKKPVDLGFTDQTTLARRRELCEDELRLNRRTSPSMYLGVRAVRRRADGSLHVDGATPGESEVVDFVVEMRRLPSERMLDVLIAEDAIDDGDLRRVAKKLATFHANAAHGAREASHGTPAHVAEKLDENARQLVEVALPHRGRVDPDAVQELRRRFSRFVAEHTELLERRVREGRIREGHGDLHAGNVCLVGDEVFVYDCVEFDLDLRTDDVACDVAFLVMDLEQRGHAEHARRLVELYAEVSGDAELARLVPFYAAHRALIRCKVDLFRAADATEDEREQALDEAARYLELASSYRFEG
ncbi:MAG: phosphotransferase [Planctomycetota bacterium]